MKPFICAVDEKDEPSLPVRGRGLKQVMDVTSQKVAESLPVRGRGLKQTTQSANRI